MLYRCKSPLGNGACLQAYALPTAHQTHLQRRKPHRLTCRCLFHPAREFVLCSNVLMCWFCINTKPQGPNRNSAAGSPACVPKFRFKSLVGHFQKYIACMPRNFSFSPRPSSENNWCVVLQGGLLRRFLPVIASSVHGRSRALRGSYSTTRNAMTRAKGQPC